MTISVEPSALGPVRAVAAEHVVAHWLSEQGGSPVLHGGRRKGHDIVDGKKLIDAKILVPTSRSEQKRDPGCTYKLRRDLWRAFDPAKTTHIILVAFPPDWIGESTTSLGKTTITIQHENVRLYSVLVEDINKLLADGREQAEEEEWAFIHLLDEWLEPLCVHPPRERQGQAKNSSKKDKQQ